MVCSFHITKAQTWASKLGSGTFVTHCIIYSGILPENEESFVKIGQSVMEKSINLLYLLMCNECSNMHINQQ